MSESINKEPIIKEFQTHPNDTGSSEVQIAILTARINHLTDHLKTHRKDFHCRRGLVALASRRRKLLNYLKKHELNKYTTIIKQLGIRG